MSWITGANAAATATEERTIADVHFIINRQIWFGKENLWAWMSRMIHTETPWTILRQREEMLTYDVWKKSIFEWREALEFELSQHGK